MIYNHTSLLYPSIEALKTTLEDGKVVIFPELAMDFMLNLMPPMPRFYYLDGVLNFNMYGFAFRKGKLISNTRFTTIASGTF